MNERFTDKIEFIPFHTCWEWSAGRNAQGYGLFWFRGSMKRASRISWELHHGPIPDQLWVLHKCDNPGCVNPDHLFLGTRSDNMKDMHAKSRGFIKPHKSVEARTAARRLANAKWAAKKRGRDWA